MDQIVSRAAEWVALIGSLAAIYLSISSARRQNAESRIRVSGGIDIADAEKVRADTVKVRVDTGTAMIEMAERAAKLIEDALNDRINSQNERLKNAEEQIAALTVENNSLRATVAGLAEENKRLSLEIESGREAMRIAYDGTLARLTTNHAKEISRWKRTVDRLAKMLKEANVPFEIDDIDREE